MKRTVCAALATILSVGMAYGQTELVRQTVDICSGEFSTEDNKYQEFVDAGWLLLHPNEKPAKRTLTQNIVWSLMATSTGLVGHAGELLEFNNVRGPTYTIERMAERYAAGETWLFISPETGPDRNALRSIVEYEMRGYPSPKGTFVFCHIYAPLFVTPPRQLETVASAKNDKHLSGSVMLAGPLRPVTAKWGDVEDLFLESTIQYRSISEPFEVATAMLPPFTYISVMTRNADAETLEVFRERLVDREPAQ